jgi:hypothetical protein
MLTTSLGRRSLSTNLEHNLSLIALAARPGNLVIVNDALALNPKTLDNCQLVPADRTMRLHDVSIAIPARKIRLCSRSVFAFLSSLFFPINRQARRPDLKR